MPMPAPAGNELAPHRQSHAHWPLVAVPQPGVTLAEGQEDQAVELAMVDAVVDAV